MCAVSATIGTWTNPLSPNYVRSWPDVQPNTAADMLRVIELLERIDRKLGATDCAVAEPEKAAFKTTLQGLAGSVIGGGNANVAG